MPQNERAILDIRKIEDYCLNPAHPRGRHKARVFQEALGIKRSDAKWLRDVLLRAACEAEATELARDAFGTRWSQDVTVRRQGKFAVVKTIWILRTEGDSPRFVTCWVI
ncbi:MAG TPA: hypothetical protein VHT51_05850 [Micropepsaceae bacterium]|nr:hypothetical protein [Micropepsaceae bacterium]